MSKTDPTLTIPAAALAHALAMTPRRLNQLVADGVLTRPAGGFTLDTVRQYVAHLKRDEATRQARRDLLLAQTEAVRARNSARVGEAFTHAEVLRRLERPILAVLAVRDAASWNRSRLLAAGIEPDLADRLAREQWNELAGLAADIRKRIETAFAPGATP
jgi:hypothetical protein